MIANALFYCNPLRYLVAHIIYCVVFFCFVFFCSFIGCMESPAITLIGNNSKYVSQILVTIYLGLGALGSYIYIG